jgi:hypothetical protein
MRWTQALAVLVILLLVAACGGGGSGDGNDGDDGGESQAAGDGNGDDGDGGDESQPADDGDGDDGDGDDGNGSGTGDLDELVDMLTPPNSTESTRTTAEGVVFVGWESTDSPESLEGFYENAIGDTGFSIISRTSAEGSFSWIFGMEDGSSDGGVVTVAPGPDGTGSTVVIQVGSGS